MNMAMSKAGKGRAHNLIVPLFVTCATYNDIYIYSQALQFLYIVHVATTLLDVETK